MESDDLRRALDAYYREIRAVILDKQHPVTGLLPASTAVTAHGDYRDAWVRDNVYSILAVWGLGLAYRALEHDNGRRFELEHRTVALMRGLLRSMMAQAHKVEAFKKTRLPIDSLHAKYDTETGATVVGDAEWGHLQIDATSLFLLTLIQMISSGLEIIWTIDEVNFVQNLVYYIERAYRTPDYGIWERGAKSNSGNVELNTSSVGMAKAALEAASGFDLFGPHGSQRSVLHVSPDNIAQADITLKSMLPRESVTKETDAAILSVIGYPAYAVRDPKIARKVRDDIVTKLQGRYGLKRFLRDGHQTVLEDEHRLYYEREELQQFANIESEWPLFYTYLYLDAAISGDAARAQEYEERLARVLVERDGQMLLPELYYVPREAIDAEKANPGSQDRRPNDNVPLVWAQSLYLLARMIRDRLIRASHIDPLTRRRRPESRRPVVQVVLLAEDEALKASLAAHGVVTQTLEDIDPVTMLVPEELARAWGQIGRNDHLGLTGRASRALKSLTTSRLYRIEGEMMVCLASFFLQREFYLAYDLEFVVRRFQSELAYLHRHWTLPGRPTVTVLLTHNLLHTDRQPLYSLVQRIEAGQVGSVPVRRGRLVELLPTASIERIDDLYGIDFGGTPLSSIVPSEMILDETGTPRPLTSAEELSIEVTTDPEPLIERLSRSDNLYEEIELLTALCRLRPKDSQVWISGRSHTIAELIEEVYSEAGRHRVWGVVRKAAALLGKVDGDLNLAVGAILVRQKVIQVGRAYSDDSILTRPLPDEELLDKLEQYCRGDLRDRVLTQELILYISLLIRSRPELFADLLTIRIGQLVLLLSSQLVRERGLTTDEAYDALMDLPPSEVQKRLEDVLVRYHSISSLPQELELLRSEGNDGALAWEQDLGLELIARPPDGWLAWRQYRGIIDRHPPGFFADVWHLFHHLPGLVIGDKLERRNRMESQVVLSDMTPHEKAFELWLAHLLNKIQATEYRQLNVEALSTATSFFRQNASLRLNDVLSLDVLIGHAVRGRYLARYPDRENGYNDHKADAWDSFYASSPAESSGALIEALRTLMGG